MVRVEALQAAAKLQAAAAHDPAQFGELNVQIKQYLPTLRDVWMARAARCKTRPHAKRSFAPCEPRPAARFEPSPITTDTTPHKMAGDAA